MRRNPVASERRRRQVRNNPRSPNPYKLPPKRLGNREGADDELYVIGDVKVGRATLRYQYSLKVRGVLCCWPVDFSWCSEPAHRYQLLHHDLSTRLSLQCRTCCSPPAGSTCRSRASAASLAKVTRDVFEFRSRMLRLSAGEKMLMAQKSNVLFCNPQIMADTQRFLTSLHCQSQLES